MRQNDATVIGTVNMVHPEQPLHTLNDDETQRLLKATGAISVTNVHPVQSLWSGYGHILRVSLQHAKSISKQTGSVVENSVILKRIQLPEKPVHPRGWHSQIAMDRKVTSYRVEQQWYERYSQQCKPHCDIPALYDSYEVNEQVWLLLQDLDATYPRRQQQLSVEQCIPVLEWLARFHALHLNNSGAGLWPIGNYWHLQTRTEEFEAMAEGALKQAAESLDQRLRRCQYKTLLHGDAKVANVCFSTDARHVALVDFQYVGQGCGICDVIYFFSSCLDGQMCQMHADELLGAYFHKLKEHLPDTLGKSVEAEWRSLYATAWADFHRFLAGWMPEHYKINTYLQSITELALSEL